MQKKYFNYLGFILLVIVALSIFRAKPVFAFPVEPLPEGNLLKNPWFRSLARPSLSGLDGWTDVAGLNKHWSTSQKESNPSPDVVISGVCGYEPVYCGTAARLSVTPGQSGGIGAVGVDAYLYQVVAANSQNQKLIFFAHWVSHKIDPAEVTIYGSTSSTGPWTKLWVPFHQVFLDVTLPPPDQDTSALWQLMTASTPPVEIILPAGYPFYKVELHAKLNDPQMSGFKMTGVYFTALPADATPTPTPSNTGTFSEGDRVRPTATPTPGIVPTSTKTSIPLNSPTPTKTPTLLASPTPTPTPSATPSPLRTPLPSPTPTKSR